MEEIIGYFKEYGLYMALPLVVAGVTQALKIGMKKFFLTQAGVRVIHFIPIVLGMVCGLALPEQTIGSKILMGGALGQMSTLIYAAVTKTFASKIKVGKEVTRKSLAPGECLPAKEEPVPEEPK